MATYLYLEKEEPMTQSIVNFLVYQDGSAVNPLIPDARVFDYRIGADAQSTYEALMNALASTLANYQNQSITQDEAVIEISRLINSLNNWSKMQVSTINGIQTTSTFEFLNKNGTSLSIPSTTMNTEMATAVDRMIRILRSAGWDPTLQPPAHASGSQVQQAMRDAIAKLIDPVQTSLYPISTYISSGLAAAQNALLVATSGQAVDTSTTSLQQLLMVEYVSYGNKILYDEMNGLSTAINYNQNALAYLNSLQNLMNQKTPEQFLMALDQLSGSSINYDTFESQSFNKTLGTTANFTEDQLASYILSISESAQSTIAIQQALSDITTEKTQIQTAAQAMSTMMSFITDTTTGLASLGYSDNREIWIGGQEGADPEFNTNYLYDMLVGDPNFGSIGNIDRLQQAYTDFQTAYNAYLNCTTDVTSTEYRTAVTNLQTKMTAVQTQFNYLIDGGSPEYDVYTPYTPPEGGSIPPDALDYYMKTWVWSRANDQVPSELASHVAEVYYQLTPEQLAAADPNIQPSYPTWVTNAKANLTATLTNLNSILTNSDTLIKQGYTPGMTIPDLSGTPAGAFVDSTTQTFNATIDQIKTNLQALISHMGTDASGSALASALRTVYNDFTNAGSVVTWVKDFTSATQQGNYQTNLNNAVVASQALNDAKREELQRVMFVFEEFYKSAMALLSRLTQLIEKMADSINR